MAALPEGRDFAAEMAGAEPDVVEPTARQAAELRPKPKMMNFKDVFRKDEARDEAPEQFLMDRMAMRPRSQSHHLSSTKVPSRRWLLMKARFWRSLMSFAMPFHGLARPRPPKPSFVRRVETDTIPIDLFFYVPRDYRHKKQVAPYHRYPIVVNFHGGGFCLGHATDDRYWARVILERTPAIFVSVNYRRAPEHPFPQPVDDCVEALLYLQAHAEELRADPSQMALSGFSAGGNLAFTVPFRLTYQYDKMLSTEHLPLAPRRTNESNAVPAPNSPVDIKVSPVEQEAPETGLVNIFPPNGSPNSKTDSPWGSSADLRYTDTNRSYLTAGGSRTNLLNLPGPRSQLLRTLTAESHLSHKARRSNNDGESHSPDSEDERRLRIVSIVAWYPLLDWTSSRSEKKRGSRNPKKTLPAVFTDLFDFSYLPAPDRQGYHCSPYASPALAPDHMIVEGLPQRIQMWLCEWDMLLDEGERFSERLLNLGKDVKAEVIPKVPHGWDKSPNPFRDQKSIDVLYERAADYLADVFGAAKRRATIGQGIGLGGMR